MLERNKDTKLFLKPLSFKVQPRLDLTIAFQPKSASSNIISSNQIRDNIKLPKCNSDRPSQKNILPPLPSSLPKLKITEPNSFRILENYKKGRVEPTKESNKLKVEMQDKEQLLAKTPTFNESDDEVENIEYLNRLSKAIKNKIFVYEFHDEKRSNTETSNNSIEKLGGSISKNSIMYSTGTYLNIKEYSDVGKERLTGERMKKAFPRHVFSPKIK